MRDCVFLDLVNKVRERYNEKQIQQIISVVVNQQTDSGIDTVLNIYANRVGKSMNIWGADEIVNHMRFVVWQAIVGQRANPNSNCVPRYWVGKSKISFIKCCWSWLVQDVRNQFAYENALKRKGDHIEIGELVGTLPDQMITLPETKELMFLIKYKQKQLSKTQLFIIKQVLEGYSLSQISEQLNIKTNKERWYYSKTKRELTDIQEMFYDFKAN